MCTLDCWYKAYGLFRAVERGRGESAGLTHGSATGAGRRRHDWQRAVENGRGETSGLTRGCTNWWGVNRRRKEKRRLAFSCCCCCGRCLVVGKMNVSVREIS